MKVRDVHCADSVTTLNILQNKRYFLKIKFGPTNLIECFKRVIILLASGPKLII